MFRRKHKQISSRSGVRPRVVLHMTAMNKNVVIGLCEN